MPEIANIDRLRQDISISNMESPIGAPLVAEIQKGAYKGEIVSAIVDHTSDMTEASEEIGMAVATRVDPRKLGQRTLGRGTGTTEKAVAQLRGSKEKLPDLPDDDVFSSLVDEFRNFQELMDAAGGGGGGGITKEDLLAALQKYDPDVTHQFAALDALRTQFSETGTEAFNALLEQTKATFEEAGIAQDVRAGFASAEVAHQAAATLETNPGVVRDMYRLMLRDTPNLGQLFDKLGTFDIENHFETVVQTFMTAAGKDLASTGPSTDPQFLHGLLTELGKLKKMQTVFANSDQVIKETERSFPESQRGLTNAKETTSNLLNFAGKTTTTLTDARNLLGGMAKASLAAQVMFGNGLKNLHAALPDDVMINAQVRHQQMGMLIGFLEVLTKEEEKEFEEEEKEEEEQKKRESKTKISLKDQQHQNQASH